MSLIRTLLNNGFFVLFLLALATLYLAYSDNIKEDHGIVSSQQASPAANPITVITPVPQPAETAPQPEPEPTIVEAPVTPTDTSTPVETKTIEAEIIAIAPEAPSTEVETAQDIIISEPEAQPSLPPMDESILAAFNSPQEAINAARQAFYDQDYLTAQKIYLPLAYLSQQADMMGELANVLYADNKPAWANKAWLESAKLLVKEGRLNDAMILAQRLKTVAPQEAQEIADEVQKIYHAQSEQQQAQAQHQAQLKAQQQARMQAYQQEMQAYQARLKDYYESQAKAAQAQAMNMQPSTPQNYAPQMPNMPQQAIPHQEWQQEQQARMQAYHQQMQAYQQQMQAYHEAQRQHAQPNAPMPNGPQPFYPTQTK